jgi:methyltransferase (TIGR00027 family)
MRARAGVLAHECVGAGLFRQLPVHVATIAAIAVNVTLAVEPGEPSKTSIASAARRALAAHDYDPTVRNPDWLAEHFLGPRERAILAGDPALDALNMDYRDGVKVQPTVVGQQLIRTRYIDEALQRAVRGGTNQLVILGAGFDSRAYRMRDLLKDVTVFEVDYGPTQEYKKQRVREILGSLPSNVVYVPIDFTREKLNDVLTKAGYRNNRLTFFVWEGVTYYIPEEAVRDTLRFVSTAARGSAVVFDAKRKSFIDWVKTNIDHPERVPEAARPVLAQQKKYVAWQEGWIFGFPDGQEREFLRSEGLELTDLLTQDGPEARRRYLTRQDGSIAFPVPPPIPDVAAPSQVGYVLEATVPRR